MDDTVLCQKFATMGAALRRTNAVRPRRRFAAPGPFALDVQAGLQGEFFVLGVRPGTPVEVAVVDIRPADRHLLLLVREGGESHHFLCGHDERHWFVAAIPESVAGVNTVKAAMEALKPAEVQQAQAEKGVRGKDLRRRRNAAYVRQGEWFFLPAPHLRVDMRVVLRNEPIVRGDGGKPHYAEFCHRSGGEEVHVCRQYPNGLLAREFTRLVEANPKLKKLFWRRMVRNADVYVKGQVRHADHKTIGLRCWHKVLMNTESQSKALENVAFLD
ncbi:hypothetical protein AYO44_09275 [Planctomycetaceae bacterium SCGC AG-212-F19]|nr:hypothetical protein AYO44_09275 [Planctomycetaceae bacterium SCGC AG-212-F19]